MIGREHMRLPFVLEPYYRGFDPVVSELQHLTSYIDLIRYTLKQSHRSMEKPL